MSENYFSDDTLRGMDARENVQISKGHQARNCAVCQLPVVDEKAAKLPLGGGLVLLVHQGCLSELVEAMQPVAVTIPVPVPSVRKSTIQGQPFDQKRMAADIKREMYELLLNEAIRQG
jgi:hypothetical protein